MIFRTGKYQYYDGAGENDAYTYGNAGSVDPFKLTFVMKGNGNSVVPNAKEWFKAEKA